MFMFVLRVASCDANDRRPSACRRRAAAVLPDPMQELMPVVLPAFQARAGRIGEFFGNPVWWPAVWVILGAVTVNQATSFVTLIAGGLRGAL